ncbi:receptor-like protein EIX2 [Vigna umbellata]|uniref:receptor-like protein EIX2 n=1 Tax=Vigna umbellata TaxID=87088 RepID=UPI001F5FE7EC|nr:receptor-like protein EIX2 [Vigna umbellata]
MAGHLLKIFLAISVCLLLPKLFSLGFISPSQSSEVKCINREREALLNFKHGLIDLFGILSTWRDDGNTTDCCKWKGIQCNSRTGHVQLLDLRGSIMHYLVGSMNLTSLIHLQNMEYLDLSYNFDSSSTPIPEQMGSFKKLRYLNLSYIPFVWGIPSQLGNLSKLEYVDLQGNSFDGAILSKLENLSKLKYLDLKETDICETIPSQLGKLTRLRYLDLSVNNLQGKIPYQLGNLSRLRYLDLDQNSFSGAIPFQVGNLPLLHTLRLGNLKINDAKWLYSLSSLRTLSLRSQPDFGSSCHMINELIPNLRELRLVNCNLSDNDFSSLFRSHSNFSTSLTILDLSDNVLTSSTFQYLFNFPKLQELYLNNCSLTDRSFLVPPASIKISLPSLFTLVLSSNLLKSTAIFHWIFNHTANLRGLSLRNNLLETPIQSGFGEVINSLEHLDLSFNKLQGEIPSSLGNIYTLQQLRLSDNNLSGELSSFIQNSSFCNFQSLDLSFNRITGMLPNLSLFTSLRSLQLSNNQLSGGIPKSIGLLYELKYLDLAENYLKGEIPAFLSQVDGLDLSNNNISDLSSFVCGKIATTNIRTLDLSNNQINGQLPDCWEHLNSLEFLDLSNNKLSGEIPHSMGTLVNLEAMVLRNNNLTGELPSTLKSCASLIIFDMSRNLLSGRIPSWIGENLQELKILTMRLNRFTGSVPVEICYLGKIHLLDLSMNHLSGGIPTCLSNFTAKKERNLITRQIIRERKISSDEFNFNIYDFNVLLMWKGNDFVFWNPDVLLNSIDLSSNKLTGTIPNEIGYLLGLVSMNLSRNNLNGEIPSYIGNLNLLEFLDLSRNNFSGNIPYTLPNIDSLGVLDLSNNNLSGRIPLGRHFETFGASSFEGNIDLCGEQLNKSCPGEETIQKPQEPAIDSEDGNSVFYTALYTSLGLGFFAGFWGLLGPMLLWQPWKIAYLRLLNRLIDYILLMVELNIANRLLKG